MPALSHPCYHQVSLQESGGNTWSIWGGVHAVSIHKVSRLTPKVLHPPRGWSSRGLGALASLAGAGLWGSTSVEGSP